MKIRLGLIILIGGLSSCQQNEIQNGSVKDLSAFAKKYLGIQSAAGQSSFSSQSSMMNQSFGAMNHSVSSGISTSVTASSDSTIVSVPEQPCWSDTLIYNKDGSTTQIFDYGDSCVQDYGDYKYIQWGKSISTYKYTNTKSGSVYTNQYFSKSELQNLGGRYLSKDYQSYWLNNGYYSYSGQSTYDTLSQTYSGSSESKDSSVYVYDSLTYTYHGTGKFTYTNLKSVQESNSYEYSEGDNFYRSVVTVPVVTDYSCNQNSYGDLKGGPVGLCIMLVPVSGHIVVSYKQDGKTGQFEIDYGDGTCDSLVTIIEDGKTIIVDLRNLYQILANG